MNKPKGVIPIAKIPDKGNYFFDEPDDYEVYSQTNAAVSSDAEAARMLASVFKRCGTDSIQRILSSETFLNDLKNSQHDDDSEGDPNFD